jgi:hypothetical protein
MQQVYDWVEYFSGEGKVSAEMRKAGAGLQSCCSCKLVQGTEIDS